jgi:hypothetical protein
LERGRFEVDDLNQNPMKLLLDVMARPDFDEWSQLAMSGIGGMFASTEPKLALGAGDGEEFLGRAARGSKAVQPSGDGGEPVALGVRADTPNGLSLALALDTRPGPRAAPALDGARCPARLGAGCCSRGPCGPVAGLGAVGQRRPADDEATGATR